MFYAFNKKYLHFVSEITPPSALPLNLVEVQQLLVSLRTAVGSPNFRLFIQVRISRIKKLICKLFCMIFLFCKNGTLMRAYVVFI